MVTTVQNKAKNIPGILEFSLKNKAFLVSNDRLFFN